MEVGIKSQEGKRKMSEDEVFGVSWLPSMRAVWGLRWRGEHPRRNPKPRTRVAVPCPFLEEAQSSFFIPLPHWRPVCHPDNIPFPLPVVQGAELSHRPSLTSQKHKANEMGVRMCSVSGAWLWWMRLPLGRDPTPCPRDQGQPWPSILDSQQWTPWHADGQEL